MPSKEEERLEEVKGEIRSYLEGASDSAGDPEVKEFSLPGLREEFPAYSDDLINEAVDDLKEEDWIEKYDIHVKIAVPTNEEGNAVVARFAERGLISMSPYWAVFLAGLISYSALHLYGKYTVGSGPPATSDLYLDALLTASIFLPVFGYTLQSTVDRIRRLKWVSEEFYVAIKRHTKLIFFSTVGLFALYWWGAGRFPYELNQSGALAVIGIGLTLGGLIAQMLHRHQADPSPSGPEPP